MDPLDPATLLHGYSIFLRASAFLFLIPILGTPVPVVIRGGAGILLAVIFIPITPASPNLQIPSHLVDLGILTIRETFIGFMMGFSVQLIFHLCDVAGRFASMQIGLMQSNLFNPLSGAQGTVLGTGLSTLSLVLIFSFDVHHMLLYAFRRSFELMPAGTPHLGAIGANGIVEAVGNIFLLGAQISAPLIAVNFIVTLAFAVLGRAVPNMNILILSFGVRIMGGLLILILVFSVVVQFLLGHINGTPERMLQFLPLPGGP